MKRALITGLTAGKQVKVITCAEMRMEDEIQKYADEGWNFYGVIDRWSHSSMSYSNVELLFCKS